MARYQGKKVVVIGGTSGHSHARRGRRWRARCHDARRDGAGHFACRRRWLRANGVHGVERSNPAVPILAVAKERLAARSCIVTELA